MVATQKPKSALPPATYTSESASMLRRLIMVRWWILVGALMVCMLVPQFLGIALPRAALLTILAVGFAWNYFSQRSLLLNPEASTSSLAVCSQLIVELVLLSAMLFLSGGATNPLIFMLLPTVAVAALSLPPPWVVGIGMLAVLAYSVLTVWFVPLAIADAERAASLHLAGMWGSFVAAVVLIAWLVARLTQLLRWHDQELARQREKEMRDERVLALGALAASAAHELGTPLATLTLLVDEVAFAQSVNEELETDLALMRQQLAHCKRVITGMTVAAGAPREEHAGRLPADRWLRQTFAEWWTLRREPLATVQLMGETSAFPAIISDMALTHGLFNLLDNALRAGPPVTVSLSHDNSWIIISIVDCGPGFNTDDMEKLAHEPFAAHESGRGVGLLLTRASVERLGGQLKLTNTARGGACAQLILPVDKMFDNEQDHSDH